MKSRRIAHFLRRHSLWLVAGLGATFGAAYIARGATSHGVASSPAPARSAIARGEPAPEVFDTVQIALLLDTSSSMDGLIHQARSQLWKMVNEIGRGQRTVSGVVHKIHLQLALYEYGNSGLTAESGYIRQVVPFTGDLDRVSEELFRLSTSGGDEYCGQVLTEASRALDWSPREDVLKYVFVAGNESFDQGPVRSTQALETAAKKGIHVQLIHCGDDDPTWSAAARFARSDLIHINQNFVAQDIPAPQDAELLQLSGELNKTYVPVGDQGVLAIARQAAQDSNARADGIGSGVARAAAKASKGNYKNDSWDLVDASSDDKRKLAEVSDEELPAELRGKSLAERTVIIEGKRKERDALQGKIRKLQAEREAFLAQERSRHAGPQEKSLDSEMLKSVEKTAASQGFRF